MDVTCIACELPAKFWDIPYVSSNFPATTGNLSNGTNCQGFAYAVLRYFGLSIPDFRSSELCEDTTFRRKADSFVSLDLLLFGATRNPFGAHVGVYAGAGTVLHLSKSVARPTLWTLSAFREVPEYKTLLGLKRAMQKGRPIPGAIGREPHS